jgi:hypothetical protein
MSAVDQKLFTDAVSKAQESLWGGTMRMITDDWIAAFHACSRLAMFDMLPALKTINSEARRFLLTDSPRNPRAVLQPRIQPSPDRERLIGAEPFARIVFAVSVVEYREIENHGIPAEQVNDGREFLGCTRLDDAGIKKEIDSALLAAGGSCCKQIQDAWLRVLVPKRRVPGGSLIANIAAAAHYMLCRFHVCQAMASEFQMNAIVEGYDAKKRLAIATGDTALKGVALTGNRPFPPDFAIRDWAIRGSSDGESDRKRCNPGSSAPIFPEVNGQEY